MRLLIILLVLFFLPLTVDADTINVDGYLFERYVDSTRIVEWHVDWDNPYIDRAGGEHFEKYCDTTGWTPVLRTRYIGEADTGCVVEVWEHCHQSWDDSCKYRYRLTNCREVPDTTWLWGRKSNPDNFTGKTVIIGWPDNWLRFPVVTYETVCDSLWLEGGE